MQNSMHTVLSIGFANQPHYNLSWKVHKLTAEEEIMLLSKLFGSYTQYDNESFWNNVLLGMAHEPNDSKRPPMLSPVSRVVVHYLLGIDRSFKCVQMRVSWFCQPTNQPLVVFVAFVPCHPPTSELIDASSNQARLSTVQLVRCIEAKLMQAYMCSRTSGDIRVAAQCRSVLGLGPPGWCMGVNIRYWMHYDKGQ